MMPPMMPMLDAIVQLAMPKHAVMREKKKIPPMMKHQKMLLMPEMLKMRKMMKPMPLLILRKQPKL